MSSVCRFSPAKPLLRFSQKLGKAAPDWSAREELEQLTCPGVELDTKTALKLTLLDLLRMVVAYGDALSLKFLLGNFIVLNVGKKLDQQALQDFQNTIRGSRTVNLRIIIDKRKLMARWFGSLFNQRKFPNKMFLYLFPEPLERFLCECSLTELEDCLWKNKDRTRAAKDYLHQDRVVFLVPGQDCYLLGWHILVLGGQSLREPPQEVFDDQRISREKHFYVHQKCQDALKWQTQVYISLTPWHIYIQKQTGLDKAAGALRIHFTNLFLLYTADRTIMQIDEQGARQYMACYSSTKQTVEVPLVENDCAEISSLPQKNFDDLLKLFAWAYEQPWNPSDRLIIIQVTIVDALRGADYHQRHRLLVENMPTILDNTNWHWKAFAKEKVELYWEQIQALEDYLEERVKAYSDQIAGMSSKLTETVLAAVGVLLGSFIAALFQGEFNASVFRIGLFTYALYVLCFPLLFNMRNQWENFNITKREFELRVGKFLKRLPDGRAEKIMDESTVNENAMRFERWFKYSVMVYLALIAFTLIAAFLVPVFMKT
jgi:hypothetical protein